ncbi:hypothetical protein GF402_07585 [Candidatus Fermentibacteria bacterium]|nr:hypothetical protein [Candidatus Fermentibacteria bacterium]
MRIGMITWGSQGDVRPFLALSDVLSRRDHRVDLVVCSIDESEYSDLRCGEGVDLHFTSPIPIDRETLDRKSWEAISDRNPVNHYRFLMEKFFFPLEEELVEYSERLCTNCDVVVKHLAVYPLSVLSERYRVPLVDISPTPIAIPSAGLPLPGVPWAGRAANVLLWRLASWLFSRLMRPSVNGLRGRFGMDPVRNVHHWLLEANDLTLLTCSPALLPEEPGWMVPTHPCGKFEAPLLEPELPERLERFLSSGPPPVYATTGSMMYFEPQPQKLLELIADAIRAAGYRGVIQYDQRSPEPATNGDDILVVGRTPHCSIFPRCRAAIHHAGAGTTHTAVENGLPSVVVMYGVDQLFWGPQLHRLGLAPKPLLRRKLTMNDLAAAIDTACGSEKIGSRVRRAAAAMSADKGATAAAELIETLRP